jgi:integrase/ribosomal protein L40E
VRIRTSLRSPRKTNLDDVPLNTVKVKDIACTNLRDIYNRKRQLEKCIKRIDTDLECECDKKDILDLVKHLQNKEAADLWIVKCIYTLIIIRKQIGTSFKDITRDDIKNFLKWMEEEKRYLASTNETFRKVIKYFYKVVYGKNEYYPDTVKWFSRKVGKDKLRQEKRIDIEEFLEEEEIQKLVNAADTIQRKAFLGCMYESGARPEEFLTLTNKDIKFDTKGAIFILRGKTGERQVRIISFVPLLKQWLSIHPLKDQNVYPLWISEATNHKNNSLGLGGAEKLLKETLNNAGLQNKRGRLYNLRHSRATHLAKRFTEFQMCTFFGWVLGTDVVRRYVHLSGRDLDSTLLAINEGGQVQIEDYKLKPLICIRCNDKISPDSKFCGKCGLSIDQSKEYLEERKIEDKIHLLEKQTETMREEINQKFTQIMKLIQQNPKLAKVKPEILINKNNLF